MSKQLKRKPLSAAKISDILSQNPSLQASPENVSPTVICVPKPTLITLKKQGKFDSLMPEEKLKDFLGFARDVITRYEADVRRQSDLEQETQDLLHYVELSDDMNACVGNKMYQKIREIRRERRACKNEIDLLKPLYDYLADKTVINQLAAIQGKCRTSKEAINQRAYTLRTDVIT